MPRNLPPSVQEKQRLLDVALGSGVFGDNLVGNFSPNETSSLGLTKDVSLVVRVVVDKDAGKAAQKEE